MLKGDYDTLAIVIAVVTFVACKIARQVTLDYFLLLFSFSLSSLSFLLSSSLLLVLGPRTKKEKKTTDALHGWHSPL